MELLFSMRRKPLKYEPPHFDRASDLEVVRPICTISCANIIAFSSPTELTDRECDTWAGHVYICDLDTPWDAHKVYSTTHSISALQWDGEGRQLLVATTEGTVTVLGQKDFLINEWVPLYTTTFPGEHIVKGCFFHNGRRFLLAEKKGDAPITEKIQPLRPAPTLKGFGGTACPGVCVVSSTGLIGCIAPSRSEPQTDSRQTALARAMESLRPHRLTVTGASTAHHNGAILVACICVTGGAAVVRCARVCVAHRAPREPKGLAPALALTLTPLPTLVCNTVPTCISWQQTDDCDSLLVYGGTVALWKLTERQHPSHKMLPKDKNLPPYSVKVWQHAGQWGPFPGPAALCSVDAGCSGLSAVMCCSNVLHALCRGMCTALYSRPVLTAGPEPAAASPPKKTKYDRNGASPANTSHAPVICCVAVSALGGAVIAIDSLAQLHAYTLPVHADIPTPLAVQQATTLLEYAIVTGTDCLDVLLTLKPNVVEAVYERLTETFQRQPTQFQHYYYHSWLKTRIALCRLIPTATCTVSWLTCVLTLWGTWCAALPALRHPDTAHPQDSAEHDKSIVSLESKLELSPETSVLTALRRPLARALDIAATALAAAADPTNSHRHHGYELWADPVGISLLRKLLILARGAGLRETALSVTLARLHQPAKPELIEECSAVSASWSARVWEVFPRTAISIPLAPAQRPLYLEYLMEPSRLRYSPEPPPCAASDGTPTAEMDSIRYMYLGSLAVYRRCARCGSRALPQPVPLRHPVQRAHDGRFLPACRCGGKWSLVRELPDQD